jgi:tellurite resistance protein TehA-like permease
MNKMKMAERLQKSPDKMKMVKAAFKQLDPTNFAFVMATGALSLGFQALGWVATAKLFLFIGIVGLIFLSLLYGVGFYMSRDSMKEGFNLEGLFKYFAFCSAASLLGTAFGWMGYGIFAIIFGAIGVLSTIFLIMVLFFAAFTQQTSTLQKLSPVWLFLPVACHSAGLVISSITKTYEITDQNLLLTAAVFWSFGLFLYLMFMALNLYRVFANAIRSNELSPSF